MGYNAGFFSFNSPGGRCEECKGDGKISIEMQFMANITLTCDTCHGRRFSNNALEVLYRGKSVYDVLEMTVNQAIEFFSQEAMQKKVFIADEQTLYAALRIIRITWTHIDQEQNHKRIFELAQEMINRTGLFLEEYESMGQSLRDALEAFESSKKKLLPGGRSIGTTANQILKLGLDNKKAGRKGKAPESIIPTEYLTQEVQTELLEEASEAPEE